MSSLAQPDDDPKLRALEDSLCEIDGCGNPYWTLCETCGQPICDDHAALIPGFKYLYDCSECRERRKEESHAQAA